MNKPAPILYSFRRCPYAMRARMAIAIAQTPVRLREIILRDKPEEMLAVSPKGTVPVLALQDSGMVIDESLAVMDWALSQNDPEGWRLVSDEDRVETQALIAESDGPFKHHLDRYKYSTRFDGADRDEHRRQGAAFLRKLNDRLNGRAYLFGDRRRFADIATFPFVRQFRIADPEWFDQQEWSPLRVWLETLTTSALFASIMNKYPLWNETNEEFAFPA